MQHHRKPNLRYKLSLPCWAVQILTRTLKWRSSDRPCIRLVPLVEPNIVQWCNWRPACACGGQAPTAHLPLIPTVLTLIAAIFIKPYSKHWPRWCVAAATHWLCTPISLSFNLPPSLPSFEIFFILECCRLFCSPYLLVYRPHYFTILYCPLRYLYFVLWFRYMIMTLPITTAFYQSTENLLILFHFQLPHLTIANGRIRHPRLPLHNLICHFHLHSLLKCYIIYILSIFFTPI